MRRCRAAFDRPWLHADHHVPAPIALDLDEAAPLPALQRGHLKASGVRVTENPTIRKKCLEMPVRSKKLLHDSVINGMKMKPSGILSLNSKPSVGRL